MRTSKSSMTEAANRVVVLLQGYVDGDRASGTVTLVTSREGHVMLVDAGDPWNGEELKKKLEERGFAPDQVTDVVVTHGHVDHVGNLGLFQRAKFVMDGDWAKEGRYGQREDRHYLSPSIWIEKRSGHTAADLIVVVKEEERGGAVVVAGDLFEDGEDEEKWRANSQLPEEQERSREYVRQLADWIVPGHGDVFQVEKR